MPIEFRCSTCGKLLRVPDEAAGKQASCPACGAVLPVPFAASAADAASAENAYRSPMFGGAEAVAAPRGGFSPTQIDLNDVFARAWGIFRARWGACLVGFVVFALLNVFFTGVIRVVLGTTAHSQALTAMSGLATAIAGWIFSSWLMAGLMLYFLKTARGEPVSLETLFSGGPYAVRVLIVNFAVCLIVMIGLFLFIIPGVILALMLWPGVWIVVDRNAPAMEALEIARQVTTGNKLTMLLIGLLMAIVGGLICAVTLGLGMLVVGPFSFLLAAVMYLAMTGQPVGDPSRAPLR